VSQQALRCGELLAVRGNIFCSVQKGGTKDSNMLFRSSMFAAVLRSARRVLSAAPTGNVSRQKKARQMDAGQWTF
jgi:hypothetical protein